MGFRARASTKHGGSCLHLLRGAASRLAGVRGGSSLRKSLLRGARQVLEASHWGDSPIALQAAGPAMLQPITTPLSLCYTFSLPIFDLALVPSTVPSRWTYLLLY